MKNVYFFATPHDLTGALARLEERNTLKYVETGTKLAEDRAAFLRASDIPKLGIASHETGSLSTGYLVSRQDTPNVSRMSATRTGERRWNLYNGDNPGTMALTPAGLWKGLLLAGNASTVHDDPDAQSLIRWFQSALKMECFAKAGRFWIGQEALHLLKAGARLSTTAEQSPPEFDLRLEQVTEPPNNSFTPRPLRGSA